MSTVAARADRLAPREGVVVAIAVLASFVTFLDGTLANVALPAIERELGGGLLVQQWVVDGYLLTLGSLILVAGSLADAYGRVRIMRIGLVGFALASLAIALAPSPLVLVLARVAQGVAGALLVPSSLALIMSRVGEPARPRAIGIWTAFTSTAMLVGPLIGGLFVDLISWRWAFVINVLPIAATLVLLARLGGEDPRRPGARVDLAGALLGTLGLAGPVFALIEEPTLGWGHPAVWVSAALGIAAFAAFLARQRVVAEPILPLGLFRVRDFAAGNLATLVIYAALALQGFVLAVYLQQGAGLSATLAGLASLPSTIVMILLSSRVGVLAGRFGARLFMTIGPLVAAGGTALLLAIDDPFAYLTQVLPGVLIFGLGLTLTVAPLTSAILGAVPPERSGVASAVNNAVARVAGLVVIAMLAPIVGGAIDLDGLHRALLLASALLALGGVVSFLGIRPHRPRGHAGSD